ncbi:MAG: PD40 domain-containing protein [Anaerolineae bacterium]|nr:PD40 domain-containing protein [Anaerolineae bacterium]
MRVLMVIACVLMSALCVLPLAAQSAGDELVGPLIAVNTAAQDEIILYDVGSGGQRHLKPGTGWLMPWGFTADGCRLIYTESAAGAMNRLYSVRLDGRDARALIQYNELPDSEWSVWEPQPSADGSRIAFTMIRGKLNPDGTDGRTWHVGWVATEGGTPEFYSRTGDEHEPEWSPDGQWLAYISYTQRVPGADVNATAVPTPEGQTAAPGTLLREADLWVVSADGAVKYPLTDFPTGSVRRPRWSPDGFLLSFIYAPSPNNDTFWMIGNSQGAIPTQLSLQWAQVLDTTWMPDSSAIVGAARDVQQVTENVLWRVPLVGYADTDATRFLPDAAVSYADYPRFSADGRWLALRSEYGVALLDAASGSGGRLNTIPPGNTAPVWSPAGFTGEASCQT